jgi:uncharacterized membrane protein
MFQDIVVPAAILIVLVLALVVVAKRARALSTHDDRSGGPVFTLHELNRLRDDGQITNEQYEKLKAQAIRDVRPESATLNDTHGKLGS